MSDATKHAGVEPGYPLCAHCGSHNVARDAWAVWDDAAQTWALGPVFDQGFCFDCDGEARRGWRTGKSDTTSRIRDLNDALRHNGGATGRVLCTSGVVAEGEAFVSAALQAVAAFDAFDEGDDPHGEHDFGSFDIDGQKLFFKIDYYNAEMSAGSEDPASRNLTSRVLTIMLAKEY